MSTVFDIPAPDSRVPLSLYRELVAWLLESDPDAKEMQSWSEDIRPPACADDVAGEIIWIILCAGRSAQAARTIAAKVWQAIDAATPVVDKFGYRAKAEAIERAWRERATDYAGYLAAAASGSEAQILDWCESIPFVGAVTKYQLAKNLGIDCCKPDICYLPLLNMGLDNSAQLH